MSETLRTIILAGCGIVIVAAWMVGHWLALRDRREAEHRRWRRDLEDRLPRR